MNRIEPPQAAQGDARTLAPAVLNRALVPLAFAAGALVLLWVGAGYATSNALALAMTLLIGVCYLAGAAELRRFGRSTQALDAALQALPQPLQRLDDWLAVLPAPLRNPVRLRVEGDRSALPGPALTPYLTGLLVLLGMLGTFLGMVVTLKGTVVALESTTDLQGIRASLAAPVQGLGVAFGTSVAGVAASAMLGLMSALRRRERQQVSQRLDALVAGPLRAFSPAHQREATLAALQENARVVPELMAGLQGLMAQLERQGRQLNEQLLTGQQQVGEQLLSGQQAFHRDSQGTLVALAQAQQATAAELAAVTATRIEQLQAHTQASVERLGASVQASVVDLTTHTQAGIAELTSQTQAGIAGLVDSTRSGIAGLVEHTQAGMASLADRTQTGIGALTANTQASIERLSSSTQASVEQLSTRTQDHFGALAAAVEQSLQRSLADSTAAATATVQAVVDSAMSGIARDTAALHARVADTAQQQLAGLAERFDGTMRGASGEWSAALERSSTRFEQGSATLLQTVAASHTALQGELAATTAGLAREAVALQQGLADTAQRTLAEALDGVAATRAALHTELAAQDQQRLAAWTAELQTLAALLREQWQQAGAQAQEQSARMLAEVQQLLQAAGEAPRAAAGVIAELRQQLSESIAHDNGLLEERRRIMETLATLLDAVNHASTEQRAAIDALVASSARALEQAGSRFSEQAEAGATQLAEAAAQVGASAVEVASLGEAFGQAVQLFGSANDTLVAQLQRVEGSLTKSVARSDEQLAYYVAQAREIIDMSLLAQKQVVDDLQRFAKRQAALAGEAA